MLRTSALIALLLAARALPAADPSLPEYVPADTKILIGVQVRAILDSDFGKAIIEQVKTASGDAWMKEMPFKGFDPLKDLDELWIVSSSMDKKAPSLVILRGRFDKSQLPKPIGSYHAVALIATDARREQLLAVVDPSTILIGDRYSVERAIDRHGSKIPPDAHMVTAATEMRSRYWIWAVADHLEGQFALKSAPQGIQAVDSLEFGLALDHDLEIAAQLHMHTAEDAQKLLATMALVQMMAQNQPQGAIQPKIESHASGKTVDLSLRVPEHDLKQAWEQQRASIAERLSQLPQQIASARAGKGFNPLAGPPQAAAPAAPLQIRAAPDHVVTRKDSKIVNDQDGNTVQLTLPGGR